MSDYKPEEIAKRLDTGIPTGPELVKAAECIRGLDELIQMQEERIEELEAAVVQSSLNEKRLLEQNDRLIRLRAEEQSSE